MTKKLFQKPLYYHQDFLCASIQQLFHNLIFLLLATTLVISQKTSCVNQIDAQAFFCFSTHALSYDIYTCNEILSHSIAYNHH